MPYAPPETLKKISATSGIIRTRFGAGGRGAARSTGTVVMVTSEGSGPRAARCGGVGPAGGRAVPCAGPEGRRPGPWRRPWESRPCRPPSQWITVPTVA
ncbi:hypothetical protein KNE206_32860 [Kitasatospora sp. NE20-6]